MTPFCLQDAAYWRAKVIPVLIRECEKDGIDPAEFVRTIEATQRPGSLRHIFDRLNSRQ